MLLSKAHTQRKYTDVSSLQIYLVEATSCIILTIPGLHVDIAFIQHVVLMTQQFVQMYLKKHCMCKATEKMSSYHHALFVLYTMLSPWNMSAQNINRLKWQQVKTFNSNTGNQSKYQQATRATRQNINGQQRQAIQKSNINTCNQSKHQVPTQATVKTSSSNTGNQPKNQHAAQATRQNIN